MIRHVMLFKVKNNLDPSTKSEFFDRLQQIPQLHANVKNWSFGENRNQRDKTYTHVYLADFDSLEELENFQADPVHKDFVSTTWKNAIDGRSFASIELD